MPSLIGVADDEYQKAKSYRPKFSKQIDSPEEYKKLEEELKSETEEQKAIANEFVGKLREPYKDVRRTRWTGPMSLGEGMELREDMYSVAFLYKLKRMSIYGDNVKEVTRTRNFVRDSKEEERISGNT